MRRVIHLEYEVTVDADSVVKAMDAADKTMNEEVHVGDAWCIKKEFNWAVTSVQTKEETNEAG